MGRDAERLDYAHWPTEVATRQALATDLFGRHVVAAHDVVVRTAAEIIIDGWRYKQPSEGQLRFLEWIAGLSEGDRRCALALVREMVDLTIFSLLNQIDGTGGHVLREKVWEQLRVVVEIRPRDEENSVLFEAEPIEALALHPQDSSGYDLHDLWFDWLKRFSRWHQEAPAPPAGPGGSETRERT